LQVACHCEERRRSDIKPTLEGRVETSRSMDEVADEVELSSNELLLGGAIMNLDKRS
jgi:hypothetical protein